MTSTPSPKVAMTDWELSNKIDLLVLLPARWNLDDYREANAQLLALINEQKKLYADSLIQQAETKARIHELDNLHIVGDHIESELTNQDDPQAIKLVRIESRKSVLESQLSSNTKGEE